MGRLGTNFIQLKELFANDDYERIQQASSRTSSGY